MKKVYCIQGAKRTGKDTIADYIQEKVGGIKLACAAPLKRVVCAMLGCTMEQLNKWKNEKYTFYAVSPTGNKELMDCDFRSVLADGGVAMKAELGTDFFTKCAHKKMLNSASGTFIVPDLRMEEEHDWFQTAPCDSVFVKVVRDVEKDANSAHITETEVDNLGYDVLVENNGTMKELYAKIDEILNNNK